jgi:hypothetical protein
MNPLKRAQWTLTSTLFAFGLALFVSPVLPTLAVSGVIEPSRTTAERATHLVCAGGKEIFILDAGDLAKGTARKIWSWTASPETGVPESRTKWFANLDDAKAVNDGKQVLISASNSGVALVDVATRKVTWMTTVRNAHTAEMLPGGLVAAASSIGGDELLIFDPKSTAAEIPIFRTPLPSAHGLVWDDDSKTLWALGYDELRAYTITSNDRAKTQLELRKAHKLPGIGGHDLRSVPTSTGLLISNKEHVYIFDRKKEQFTEHATLGKIEKVKSIDVHPQTGQIVHSLWGQKVTLTNPDSEVKTGSSIVYKARWFTGDIPFTLQGGR